MFKEMKLKPKHYKDLRVLLTDAGLVSEDKKSASPELIAVHPSDYKKIRKALSVVAKKRGIPPTRIDYAVGIELLNLGPVECLGVKPGYAVINKVSV